MSGLDVENFNLFGKKTNKIAPRPVAVPVTTSEVVEKEIRQFDSEVVKHIEEMKAAPAHNQFEDSSLKIEIERFEETKSAPAVNTVTELRPVQKEIQPKEVTLKVPEKNKEDAPLRKFETFVAPTFRIPEGHDLELKKIEHFIMRNRKKGNNSNSRERITTNSVVRAMIANFLERAGDMDFSNIDNEEMLKERMEKVFKQKYNKKV